MRLRIFTEPQVGASYETVLAMARCAEQEGFDAFFRSDHYQYVTDDGLPGPTDAWITLAGLARETSTIRLGTLVSPITFRLPGVLAISVAQVDAMSDGRVELGLGAGWFDKEHHSYAIPFPPARERFERLEEQLEIVRGLWETPIGSHYSFTGRHYAVENSPGLPKPVQRPHPPIIVGGAGKKRTPALAARFADEFNAISNPAGAADAYASVRAACEATGRDPATLRLSAAALVFCGKDEAEAERRAERIGATAKSMREAGYPSGTPAQVLEVLGGYADLGVEYVYLQFLDLDDLDHLRLIAAEVLPNMPS